MPRPTVIRVATFLATVVAAWGVLSLGAGKGEASDLHVGDLATRDYTAQTSAEVIDTVATANDRQAKRDEVDPILETDVDVQTSVEEQVNELFSIIDEAVAAPASETTPTTTIPPTTTTTQPTPDSSTTTTESPPAEMAHIAGVVFLDVDGVSGYQAESQSAYVDAGRPGISVIVSSNGQQFETESGVDGTWAIDVPAGDIVVTVLADDPDVPTSFRISGENGQQQIDCRAGEDCATEPVGFAPASTPIDQVVAEITTAQPVTGETVQILAMAAIEDITRDAMGLPSHLDAIQTATLLQIRSEFGSGVTSDNLLSIKAQVRTITPLVFYEGEGQDTAAGQAAGDVVATYLLPNRVVDQSATEEAKAAAEAEVKDVTVDFTQGETIVSAGERLDQLDIDAIGATSGSIADTQQGALLLVLAVLVGIIGLYLSRFRPEFWARPRMVALLGILIVLAAGAVRATVIFQSDTSWYILPAVAFGFMTAVLFDSRIAVLMALCIGVLSAVGAGDAGIAVYGTLATMAPIPFVSSVSSRGAFRTAVVFSSLAAAVIAASTSWFFHSTPSDIPVDVFGFPVSVPLVVIGTSMVWAFGISAIASLVGLAALQFFESAFDITTSLSLLDLTDRNHEALQLLQEKAFGSFNHSLMVGTLAHAAARAIGANALLARAMAYYHDLGKTENPTMFIENQFGIQNPHDFMTPRESAQVIRSHVSDGITLAKKFKIPSDVATGIVSHHGDGIMRYFYEKARSEEGESVNPDDFRHIGHKPRTAESAIVMLADSLEAACRAVFQTEEPTPEAIEKVVNRVVDEKMNDGQLSESPLTLAEVSQIRSAFLDSLVGHYHQRIAYPNFPGS
ncbi:MAG: HDIG domain-containing metalloprotein [Acidimicrobiia bacterium]